MARGRLMVIVVAALGALALFVAVRTEVFRDDKPAETLGRALYQEHCARCHGVHLEGQPDWQTPLPSGRLPAPPHDASGHTWHHADRVLVAITKHGTAAVVGGGYESDMPGFAPVMSEEEMRAVLAFIKSTWPERERRYQEAMSRRDAAERADQGTGRGQ